MALKTVTQGLDASISWPPIFCHKIAKALYYGNNLQVLRDEIATESVDLIYLDPPFDSNAT